MHPYIWGKVRFSVWLAVVAWGIGATVVELWLQPFPIFPGLVGIFIIGSLLYLGGRILTAKHPFFPEIISTAIWRFLRRAFYLHS